MIDFEYLIFEQNAFISLKWIKCKFVRKSMNVTIVKVEHCTVKITYIIQHLETIILILYNFWFLSVFVRKISRLTE